MVLPRRFTPRLGQLLRRFPIVCILGPRQCGKTTFIRNVLTGWSYLDLERPSDLARISADPEDLLRRLKSPLILDEAQRLPELFPVLRSFVDERRTRRGRIVLLGSASPSLIRGISESLAGRIGFLDMTPFHWDEVQRSRKTFTLERLWFRGGFPDAFLAPSDAARTDWFEGYTRSFIERDLAALGIEVSSSQMRRLWTMLAHLNGSLWNASQIAASLGVTYHTVNRYTDILEQTYLVRKLPPYFANIGKRLVKSPKLYFRDTGLLHSFLGLREVNSLETHPARGTSWEAFVIEHIISAYQERWPGAQAFFWRTAVGAEADLLIQKGGRLIPFEIKIHSSPGGGDAAGLISCIKELKLDRGYLIYPGTADYSLGHGVRALSAKNLLAAPSRLLQL